MENEMDHAVEDTAQGFQLGVQGVKNQVEKSEWNMKRKLGAMSVYRLLHNSTGIWNAEENGNRQGLWI